MPVRTVSLSFLSCCVHYCDVALRVRVCVSATQVVEPWPWLENMRYTGFEIAVEKN